MPEKMEKLHSKPRNEAPPVPVPEIHARANNGHPIIGGTSVHDRKASYTERPISQAYAEIDNDLARDNIENDLPDADLQDL